MGIPIYVVARCHFRTEVGRLKKNIKKGETKKQRMTETLKAKFYSKERTQNNKRIVVNAEYIHIY